LYYFTTVGNIQSLLLAD